MGSSKLCQYVLTSCRAKTASSCLTGSCTTKGAPFKLGAEDSCLFDAIASEHVKHAGTTILYWSLDRKASIKNPLYDEFERRVWKGPYRMTAFVEKPSYSPDPDDEGFKFTFEGSLWVSRKEFELNGVPIPKEGDVAEFWQDYPYFSDIKGVGTPMDPVPGSRFAFSVNQVDEEGHINDTGYFVGFNMTLSRLTAFTPERQFEV